MISGLPDFSMMSQDVCSQEVLEKQDKLTSNEWEEMKSIGVWACTSQSF